ncbi:MAG: hypothetical protein LBQ49_00080 [Rickettsiales bacterium]|jgi:hypothetical protein|nr:hypothetical protein [Rickettsiales bacterium]
MKIHYLILSLPLLVPSLAQAGTCKDFDANLNIIEYDCASKKITSQFDNSYEWKTDITVKLGVGLSLDGSMNNTHITDAPYEYGGTYTGDGKYVDFYDWTIPMTIGAGIRYYKWNESRKRMPLFFDFGVDMVLFGAVGADSYTGYWETTETLSATGYFGTFGIGTTLPNTKVSVYSNVGLGIINQELDTGVVFPGVISGKEKETSLGAKFAVGTEFKVVSWMNIYLELAYLMSFNNKIFGTGDGYYFIAPTIGTRLMF